jgi:hypothetical protein
MNDNTKTDDRPARKRHGKVKWIVGGFAVLAIAGAVGSHGGSTAKAADPAPAAASQSLGDQLRAVGGHEVAYKVTGTTLAADLTITTRDGGTSQLQSSAVPFSHIEPMTSGQFFYISAQNHEDKGTVTCTVEVDGQVVSINTSSGAYVIASCSGTV